ncbi:MAG: hypothetical protein ACI4UK_09775 [Floccifex sp.]
MFFKEMKNSSSDTISVPKRVYTLYKKVLDTNGISRNDLRDFIEPNYSNQESKIAAPLINATTELGLIYESDSFYYPISKNIHNMDDMRMYINVNIDQLSSGAFYAITSSVFTLNKKLFLNYNTYTDITTDVSSMIDGDKYISKDGLHAWRFWVSFLGFGYMQESFFLPNAAVFLEDLIRNSNITKNKSYIFKDFVDHLSPAISIICSEKEYNERILNFGLSSALFTLKANRKIDFYEIMDNDIWHLCEIDKALGDNVFTNITVL